MPYILLLSAIYQSGQGNSTLSISHEFSNSAACHSAGSDFSTRLSKTYSQVIWSCYPNSK